MVQFIQNTMENGRKPVSSFTILSLSICYFYTFHIHYNFNFIAQSFLFLLTFLATQSYPENIKRVTEEIPSSRVRFSSLFFVNLYATFCFAGGIISYSGRIFFLDILHLFMIFLWMFPFVTALFSLFLKRFLSTQNGTNYDANAIKSYGNKLFIVVFLLTILFALPYLYVYNPAISTYDTVSQFKQALGIETIVNWHSPLHTYIIRILLSICNHPSIVVLVQYFLAGMLLSSASKFIYFISLNRYLPIFFSLFISLNPSNMLLLTTIWKDIPYTLSILWITLLFCKLVWKLEFYNQKYMKSYIYFEIALALFSLTILRQNGFVPAIFCVVSLFLICRQKTKVFGSLAIASLCFVMVTGPLYSSLNVVDTDEVGAKYMGLGQDIVGVSVAGGSLGAEAAHIVDELIGSQTNYEYVPTYALTSYHLDVPMTYFLKAYIDTFLKNPITMTKMILHRNVAIWDMTRASGLGLINASMTQDSVEIWNEMAPQRQPVNGIVTRILDNLVLVTEVEPFSWFLCRAGLYTFFMIACIVVVCTKKSYQILACFAPVLGQIFSLLVSTGWSEYRYYWSIPLCVTFFLFVFLSPLIPENDAIKRA